MKRVGEKICAWGGIAFSVMFFLGFMVIARFIPPLSPGDTAAEIAAIYRDHTQSIRTGVLFGFVSTMCLMAFGASIAGQTRRIRGISQTIANLQVASIAVAVVMVVMPMPGWWTAAFRPELWSDQTILLLNDYSWIIFVIGFVGFVAFFAATGFAILSDESDVPLYPRWAGYLSIFLGTVQMSAAPLVYFKDGPFAWNGLIAFWMPVVEFFSWFIVFTVLTLRAIDSDYDDPRTDDEPDWLTNPSGAALHMRRAAGNGAGSERDSA
jgi:hypothetical protein